MKKSEICLSDDSRAFKHNFLSHGKMQNSLYFSASSLHNKVIKKIRKERKHYMRDLGDTETNAFVNASSLLMLCLLRLYRSLITCMIDKLCLSLFLL